MTKRERLEKEAREIASHYSVNYYSNPLWSGSVEAPAGWYLSSDKWAATDGNGRGKWLGRNYTDASDSLSTMLM